MHRKLGAIVDLGYTSVFDGLIFSWFARFGDSPGKWHSEIPSMNDGMQVLPNISDPVLI